MIMMLSEKTQGILDALETASSEATGGAQTAIANAIIRLRTLDAAYEGSKRRREELEEEVARLKYELDEALGAVRVLTEELDEALLSVRVLEEDLDERRRDSWGD